ncbi:MAG TPA: DEAD/DEAH box helicase [Longimicrobiales bacterium]
MQQFHPLVQKWWQRRFRDSAPTPAQAAGWAAIRTGQHTLIAAPTGSGKTLAAFLHSIDELLREGLAAGELPDETRVLYVSPLKALSSDIHKNLAEPRRELREIAEEAGLAAPKITAAVRSGDTPQAERAAMLRRPPHILVTTPESLYLLLTSERSREMLRTVRTVIVDEIHAVVESRRGAHLALSLERLEHVVDGPLQRIGLSATQKPIDQVARFLTGERAVDCAIIDKGHQRHLDLALELPGSPLEAVMSAEVWQEVYARIAELIDDHRTTLVFVNTRRMAERVAHNLSQRLGAEHIMTHHGSLAKEVRLDAEEKLKTGKLKALVATASLELGIDIGHVDLVVQIGTPRRISTFLQRVGRSGHTVQGTPKGRLFPLTRDELVECAALLGAVRAGELDRIRMHEKPLDVLAQQVVAEVAAQEWAEQDLLGAFRAAYPYRDLQDHEFSDVVQMLARGYATRRGRRAALIHYDAVNKKLRARRGSRLIAITSGGAIPEITDYKVVSEPDGTFVGTVNEDFAVESLPGDVMQLGNTSWRILRIQSGVVRVADAQGVPPSIPFWLGEAPARSDELSAAVAQLRAHVDQKLDAGYEATIDFVAATYQISRVAAAQIVAYLAETKRLLGALPTQDTLILERFFDEAGGMQLILHAPFGGRVNRAWGLALRKKFCQNFNFELQAAATEEGVLISLGPQHSFPLEDVFRYVTPSTSEHTLVQAVLDSPIFTTRWRWSATLSLAVPRNRGGRKVPPPLQRMIAEDLLTAVFPDAAACFENIQGEREVPDHPLVNQALRDCLEEGMDLPQLNRILQRIQNGDIRCIGRDTPEPSPLSHEILNAKVYQFLDDAPLEERRAQAVYTRRALEPTSANDLGALDQSAIDRVRAEAWPDADDADELHDALLISGFLRVDEIHPEWQPLLAQLSADRRVAMRADAFWFAVERIGDELRDMLRSRMEISGPMTEAQLHERMAPLATLPEIEQALIALETEGVVLRGYFTPGVPDREWCDRRLLARIHSYTLNRLRAEIQPVHAAELMRFLFRWQRVHPDFNATSLEGLAAVIEQLSGTDAPAAAWEADILPVRVRDYQAEWLDMLSLTGRVRWGRLSARDAGAANRAAGPVRSSPIALFTPQDQVTPQPAPRAMLSSAATSVFEVLEARGASFFHDIVRDTRLLPTHVEQALGELVTRGYITSDSFSGLRALLTPTNKRPSLSLEGLGRKRRGKISRYSVETAGRWALLSFNAAEDESTPAESIEAKARALLRRYGVVFRRLLARENDLPSWRELVMFYRRLEARGEIRGGRFVAGMAGEQFALPEAVGMLRSMRREQTGEEIIISAADPLNLVGLITPEERIPALTGNRIYFLDGVPRAALVGGELRKYSKADFDEKAAEAALRHRRKGAPLRSYLRSPETRQRWLKQYASRQDLGPESSL